MYSKHIVDLSAKLATALYNKHKGKSKKDRDYAIERSVRAIADALIKFPTYDTLRARICSELRDIKEEEKEILKELLNVVEKFREIEDPLLYTRLAINIPYLVMGYVKALEVE